MDAFDTTVIPKSSAFDGCRYFKLLVVANHLQVDTTVVLKRDEIGGIFLLFHISGYSDDYKIAIPNRIFG